jgi:hypothetical protein
LGQPTEARRERNGFLYNSVSFPTAITAAKAGTLEIPSASLDAVVQVPAARPPGMDDFFGGFFGNLGLTETREVKLETDPAQIEVKPLPKEGRPGDFSGGVGEFRMEVEAMPKQAAPGEPVTLKVTLAGRGNFEAMGAPVLVEAGGWKLYDPAENFVPSPSDPIGFNGEKTYEYTLVARQDQQATPAVRFSYFDPSKEKYVTLEGPPVAVEARGVGGALATPSPATGGTPPPPQLAATEPPPPPAETLSTNHRPSSFTPAAWNPALVAAGLALAALWTIGLIALVLRSHAASPAAALAAERRRQRASLRSLAGAEDAEFLETAARFAEARLAGRAPSETSLGDEERDLLETLLATHAEARYAPRARPTLTPENRAAFQRALKALDACMP